MMSAKHYPMKSDIREKKDSYLLEIDLPGCQKEDIKAYIENGYLNIAASMNKEKTKGHGRFLRHECYSGDYHRSFYVGRDVRPEDIRAVYKRGILTVSVPKEAKEAAVAEKPEKIAITG